MSLKIVGTLNTIGELQVISEKMTKREFSIKFKEGNYDKLAVFQLINNNCGALDSFQINQEIEVNFNIDGREWNGRIFINLNAWKIVLVGIQQATHAPQQTAAKPVQAAPQQSAAKKAEEDDLPF